jgi:tRNA pseudouridine55 synthase
MVSAIKVQGKRLYKMARQGKTISRTPRKIHIYDLELLYARYSILDTRYLVEESSIQHPASSIELDFRVRCSRGTYIRALAADIGDALGCGAHLSRLIRTKSGIFELTDSIPLGKIQADPRSALQSMRAIDDVLSFMPKIVITSSARRRFLNGVSVSRPEVVRYEPNVAEFQADDLIRVHDEAGMLLGIGRATGAYNQPTGVEGENTRISDRPPRMRGVRGNRTTICKVVRVLRKS